MKTLETLAVHYPTKKKPHHLLSLAHDMVEVAQTLQVPALLQTLEPGKIPEILTK